jgi:FkbM family methyltransferase
MTFSWLPYKPAIGRLLKFILPDNLMLPILQGRLKTKKWIVGSGNIEHMLGSYECENSKIFETRVRDSSVVYDIGAHVGFYTLLASELVGAIGKVIAFEPLPRNIYYLKKHLSVNHCDNVTVIEAAVSDKSKVSLFNDSLGSYQSHLSDDGNLIVNVVSIDNLVERGETLPPDYIKIDVEGSELLVLKGAKATLDNYNTEIYLSTHSPELHMACCEYLLSLNYKLKPIIGSDLYNTNQLLAYKK